MPAITDAAWSGEHHWLNVSRLKFVPKAGDTTDVTLYYQFNNSIVIADPGAGNIRLDSADLTAVTLVAVSDIDRNGADQNATLALIEAGMRISIIQDTGRQITFQVNADPVDNTTWWQFSATPIESTGLFQNNADLDFTITFDPATLPQGNDRLEIRMAQEWPWVIYRSFSDQTAIIPNHQGVIPSSDIQIIELF